MSLDLLFFGLIALAVGLVLYWIDNRKEDDDDD